MCMHHHIHDDVPSPGSPCSRRPRCALCILDAPALLHTQGEGEALRAHPGRSGVHGCAPTRGVLLGGGNGGDREEAPGCTSTTKGVSGTRLGPEGLFHRQGLRQAGGGTDQSETHRVSPIRTPLPVVGRKPGETSPHRCSGRVPSASGYAQGDGDEDGQEFRKEDGQGTETGAQVRASILERSLVPR